LSEEVMSQFGMGKAVIRAIEVVMSGVQHAVLYALGQYSNAVSDRVKIGGNELHEEVRIGSTS
jgi:hypothetical protein